MKKITNRDLIIFFLGMFTFFMVDIICDWDSSVKAFKKGFYEAYHPNLEKSK